MMFIYLLDGVQLSPPENLLTSFEIYLLASLFVRHGVSKIRLTGGEPTVRRDIIDIVRALWSLRHKGLQDLCMTTNGLALHRKLDQLVDAGLNGINLSLDTLDPRQFELLTRRNGLSAVMQTLERLLDLKARGRLANLKVNSVIMRGVNEDQVIPLANLSKENNLEVRFIEYMPFSGNAWDRRKMIPHKETLDSLRSKYPGLGPAKTPANSTSRLFEVPGHRGRIGFITSMTDDFCSTCNRLRITSDGNLKVCLFGNSEISLKDIIRKHTNNYPSEYKSISTVLLGGEQSSARLDSLRENVKKELLQAVHSALQRKKEKHAGLGALENMKNRPMILIGG